MKRRTFLKAVGLTLALPATRALAQVGSGRTIRMVVPLPAGTSNDSATRVISAALSPLLGQAIVVDNRAGGAGLIGTMEVVRANPDGLTLMCASLSPLAANVAFVKNLPYDPRRDLTPIAGATLTNHVLVVAPNSPIRTFADFIAYAKQRPGQVTIGYSTAIVQLQIATLNKLAGIELMPVPYRGAPASVTDVMAGVLTATMANPGPDHPAREKRSAAPPGGHVAEAQPGHAGLAGDLRNPAGVRLPLVECLRRPRRPAAGTGQPSERGDRPGAKADRRGAAARQRGNAAADHGTRRNSRRTSRRKSRSTCGSARKPASRPRAKAPL